MKYFTLCFRYCVPDIDEFETLKEAKHYLNIDTDECAQVLCFNQIGEIVYVTDFYKDRINDFSKIYKVIREKISTAYNKDCAVTVAEQPSLKPDKSGFA